MRASAKGRRYGTPERRADLLAVLRSVGPGDDCILWPWSGRPDKYSSVQVDGRSTTAHRWVYEQINGPIPGLDCAHTCDVPACVRPSHLVAMTHGENLADAYRKGRKTNHPVPRPGEAHHNARLTAEHIRRIRGLYANGVSQTEIADLFGISRPFVSQVVNRKRWTHVE